MGCGFPGIVNKNKILSAANVSNKWVGVDVSKRISRKTGCESFVLNDADAAGLAEMKYGSGKNKKGTVLMITVGTGLGTSIFIDGKLVPNIEFGHLKMYGDFPYIKPRHRKIDYIKKMADALRPALKNLMRRRPDLRQKLDEYLEKDYQYYNKAK